MTPDEREKEAYNLIKRAEGELAAGAADVLKTLEGVASLSESPLVLFWEGFTWLQFGGEGREQGLIRAVELLERAVEEDRELACAWKALGVARGALGATYGELDHFQEAEQAFACASHQAPYDWTLWWEWGNTLSASGAVSEEAIDYRTALEKFERAEQEGAGGELFWLAYGNAYRSLANLIADTSLLLRAISCFERAAEGREGRLAMADTLAHLYAIGGGELSFDRAYVAYVSAAQHAPTDATVQLHWAHHLIRGGILQKRPTLIEEALEKMAAAEMAGEEALACGLAKAEAFTELGRLTDQLAHLYEAQRIGEELVTQYPSDAYPYLRFAAALAALGEYFVEAPYVQEALSHFQQAIHLDPACYEAHLEFACLLVELGIGEEERSLLEQAIASAQEALRSPLHAADAHHILGIGLAKLAEIRNRSLLAKRAVDYFEQAILLRGGKEGCPIEWLLHYGCALDLLGTFHEDEQIHLRAVQILEHVVENSQEDLSARFQLAMAYVHYGELACDPGAFDKALRHLEQTVTEQPDEEVVWDEWGCTLLSYAHLVDDPAHLEAADLLRDQAREKLLTAVQLGSGDALYHLAWLYAEIGEHERATTFLEKAAVKGALPPRDELMEEEWLGSLRHTEVFRDFLDRI